MTPSPTPPGDRAELISELVTRTIVLLETEYPNVMRVDLPAAPARAIIPRGVHPAFYGCYDWHSSVHSHWQVVRALRAMPGAWFEGDATAVLDRTLTAENVAVEMSWISDRPSFEMPYGMAWALRLCRELREWDDDRARRWSRALATLEVHALGRFERYCATLTVPMRGGLHSQSAFSLGLVWDSAGDEAMRDAVDDAACRFFGSDTAIDLRYEPSAADFLSPALSEADAMRRVLPGDEFVGWLEMFAPEGFHALTPVEVVDPSNGQLAHWAGLNLSRSWMMASIADALPRDHPFVPGLRAASSAHTEAGLATATHDHLMISHWVPTFAVFLLTGAAAIHTG